MLTEDHIKNIMTLEHTDVNPLASGTLRDLCTLALKMARFEKALKHCVNALKEYERDPSDNIRGFLLGALDSAKAALAGDGGEEPR